MSSNFKNEILWTKDELIKASKGQDLTKNFLNDKKITGISIDTRTIEQNDLFIAIKGKNFDGHNFLEKAIKKGASGVIVSCKSSALRYNGLFVKNTHTALINFAEFSRNRFKGKIIGITGSNGKTTTKDMAKIAFSEFGKTFATPGNNNNIIGLSL
jgi:UDP-N-acetylmuramoyl-tripeptide--D-alanyl-D-alanine ligase